MSDNRVLRYVPLALLALVLVIAYWRLFIGEAFFWGLPALQFVPWRAYGFDAIRAGHLPLWNPYNGAGAPLFANYQSAFLYPLNWPGLLTPNYAALGWQMSVTAVLHLFIGGWGMWKLTGAVDMPPLSRGVSALAYALTGYVVGRLGTYPIVSVTAWIPWMLWAVQGIIERGRRRDVAWLALIVGMVLTAGHAQTAWYALLLAGAYAVWCAVTFTVNEGDVWHRPYRRLIYALAAVMLGAGLAAMQLAATADLLVNSQRSDSFGEEQAAFNFSYAPLRIPNLIAPNVYGNPGDGSYLPSGLFYEEAVYVGLVPLVAAFTAMFAFIGRLFTRKRDERRYMRDVPFWFAVFVIAFVFALGRHTPVFPFLYRNVPTFDMFQAPGRWHIITVFALSVLAGVGVAQWGVGKWVIFWTRLTTAGAVGAGLLAVLSPQFLPPDTLALEGVQVLTQQVAMTALWVVLAGVLTLLYAPNVPERFLPLPGWYNTAWALLVLVVVGADLGWATRGLNPTVPAAFYNPLENVDSDPMYRAYWPEEDLNLLLYGQRESEDGALETIDADELGFEPWLAGNDYRIAQENWRDFRELPLPNMNLLDRVYLLNNFDPLLLEQFAELVDNVPTEEQAQIDYLRELAVDRIYTVDGEVAIDDPARRVEFAEDSTVITGIEEQFSVLRIDSQLYDDYPISADELLEGNYLIRDLCGLFHIRQISNVKTRLPVECAAD
ncbi:MAG: hypothetical protein AAF787_21070, partial [Chloroflexota bacterium]